MASDSLILGRSPLGAPKNAKGVPRQAGWVGGTGPTWVLKRSLAGLAALRDSASLRTVTIAPPPPCGQRHPDLLEQSLNVADQMKFATGRTD